MRPGWIIMLTLDKTIGSKNRLNQALEPLNEKAKTVLPQKFKIPKIGITTHIIRQSKWYKHFQSLGFDTLEINRQMSKLYLDLYFCEKIKHYTKNVDLSIHSGTKGVFQPNSHFTKANLAVLTAEVELCAILGARQLVFHLSDGLLSADEKKQLAEVIAYAKRLDIRMMYESNSVMIARDAYEVLNSFPDLGYVLDLGHLNNGFGRGRLGCKIDEFIRNIRERIEYIHASNNCGTRDEHEALSKGTLNWRFVLDMIDLSKVEKIIIEVRDIDMVECSYNDLSRYLGSKTVDNPCFELAMGR